MKLSDFLADRNIGVPEFGRRIGVSAETIRRYCDEGRVPKPIIMRRIFAATDGLVTPNDFAGLGPSPQIVDAA